MTDVPAGLQAFEATLIGSLRMRQATRRRRKLVASAVVAALALAATAVAGTRALDDPTVGQQNHTPNLPAARALLAGFLASDTTVDADLGATRLLATLGATAGPYAGLNAYITPTLGGGSCIVFLNAASCGGPPTASLPVRALGLGQYSSTPFLLVGIEGDFVTKHLIRCGDSIEDVTANAGARTFVYVARAPSIDPSTCQQVFTLEDGSQTTTGI
jgi:hypothetical protein